MNIIKSIGLGMGVYIGWSLMEAIDEGTKRKVGRTIIKRIRSITEKEPKRDNEQRVIGFRAD